MTTEQIRAKMKEGTVLVDFFATWCNPCKSLSQELDQVTEAGKKVIKVDIERHSELAEEYGVMSVPTVYIFKDAEVQDSFIGIKRAEEIIELINKYE